MEEKKKSSLVEAEMHMGTMLFDTQLTGDCKPPNPGTPFIFLSTDWLYSPSEEVRNTVDINLCGKTETVSTVCTIEVLLETELRVLGIFRGGLEYFSLSETAVVP